MKILGMKNYGSIPHLPQSRMGPGDHKCSEGQARIATAKTRDRHDRVIVQEKLDGSNVGVARIDGVIHPLTRAGHLANTSRYPQHHHFHAWVYANQDRFLALLQDGERLCGEWLWEAHGTRYALPHEPFVAFDLMVLTERLPFALFTERVQKAGFVMPAVLSEGPPLSVEQALAQLGRHGFHGALDPVEGAVWRIERQGKVDFLVKYVRPDKQDGIYLNQEIWNTWTPPEKDVTSSLTEGP